MKLNVKAMLILLSLTASACDTEYFSDEPVFEREPICTQHAASIAWLLANDERQFALALDKNNTLAGGC